MISTNWCAGGSWQQAGKATEVYTLNTGDLIHLEEETPTLRVLGRTAYPQCPESSGRMRVPGQIQTALRISWHCAGDIFHLPFLSS